MYNQWAGQTVCGNEIFETQIIRTETGFRFAPGDIQEAFSILS